MIPIFQPHCCELEIEAVTKVLESKWWGQGPKVEEFEEKFAKFVDVKHAIAVNSGTAALHLALKVLDLKARPASIDSEIRKFMKKSNITDPKLLPPIEVVPMIAMPALTFISTALAALYNDCVPYFVDIDEETLCMNLNLIPQNDKIAAIVPVHYSGTLMNLPTSFKGDYPKVVEDCAHACGTTYAGQQGDLACWSFHAVKNLATGDGGMVTTNDDGYYQRIKDLRWCGIMTSTWERTTKKYGWDYQIAEMGYKCHMNDITAALGIVQLRHLTYLNTERRTRANNYRLMLKNVTWIRLPQEDPNSSNHMFVIRVPADKRNTFIDHMLEKGVSVGVHYKPLQHYPMFKHYRETPITERVWQELVTLPLYPDLTLNQQDYIVNTIKKFPI